MTTSSFFGLDLALRALQTQQRALDTTNHNVANANTPGFSRQSVVMETTEPFTLPAMNRLAQAGQLGTGVIATTVQRARDSFLDAQYRQQASLGQQAETTHSALQQVEAVLNEPSSHGISTQLGAFYDAWQEVANDPTSTGARGSLVQAASALADSFNRAASQLTAVQTDMDNQITANVNQVDDYAKQIAALNGQIVQVEVTGQEANDFRDRRDLLLDQLSALVQTTTTENPDGTVNVALGNRNLVSGVNTDLLTTTPTGPNGYHEVRFSSDNALATLNSGTLRGLVDVRDNGVVGYLNSLNGVAASLMTAVNGLHSTGYGQDNFSGRAFFTGSDAATMAVNPVIAADPRTVAVASGANLPGDNTVALGIAQLRTTMNPTSEASYAALVTKLGQDSKAADDLSTNQQTLVDLIDRRRQEVSGVSLDEEAVNLLRFQRAYEASARLITAYDQMLDRLINSTGLVGR